MTSITIEQAQARLGEFIDELAPGEDAIVTRNDLPIAKLSRTALEAWPCRAGSAKDKILWISPDFDAPLNEFHEYME